MYLWFIPLAHALGTCYLPPAGCFGSGGKLPELVGRLVKLCGRGGDDQAPESREGEG